MVKRAEDIQEQTIEIYEGMLDWARLCLSHVHVYTIYSVDKDNKKKHIEGTYLKATSFHRSRRLGTSS